VKDDFCKISEISVLRRDWDSKRTAQHIRGLPIWTGDIEIQQLFGGLQNRTYFVTDGDRKRYVVRCGVDQFRTRQTSVIACTIAAQRLGIGPALRYAEPNLTVTDFVNGPQVRLEQQRDPVIVGRIVDVMKILHDGSESLPSSISYWAPFHTVRRYLREMETGFESTGFRPSVFVSAVSRFREVTYRLERAIAPFIPVLTHNDLGFANIMFRSPELEDIWFIDWDGGGYGNPLWDIAEMSMWADGGEELDRFVLTRYFGAISDSRMKERLHEHVALKLMAALRLITECAVVVLDPYYYLTPEETAKSMKVNFADQGLEITGLVTMLLPGFDRLWQENAHRYP
jgi:thiamine kinase-like enzyme